MNVEIKGYLESIRACCPDLDIQNARLHDKLDGQFNVAEFDLELPVLDGREVWAQLFEDFKSELFQFMRPDAQQSVSATFDQFLNDPRQFEYTPAFRHGDFGPGNILYDPEKQKISGIIDFDSIGVDDPALDVGAILNLGEDFFSRMCPVYPEMSMLRERVAFYRSTFALQEALYSLRDNVMESFEAGHWFLQVS